MASRARGLLALVVLVASSLGPASMRVSAAPNVAAPGVVTSLTGSDKRCTIREHPAPGTCGGFIDGGVQPTFLQAIGAMQPSRTTADDGNGRRATEFRQGLQPLARSAEIGQRKQRAGSCQTLKEPPP